MGQKGVSNREFKPFQEKQSPSASLSEPVIIFFLLTIHGHYFYFFALYFNFNFFPLFWGMKMYDNKYDTKETKIIQG